MNEESNRESLYREELPAAESISNEQTVKFPQELYPENVMDRAGLIGWFMIQ